jgi:hypothetical protein
VQTLQNCGVSISRQIRNDVAAKGYDGVALTGGERRQKLAIWLAVIAG